MQALLRPLLVVGVQLWVGLCLGPDFFRPVDIDLGQQEVDVHDHEGLVAVFYEQPGHDEGHGG